ncbi:hypothetical protein QBC35DRAFT_291436 [Podospora australis]|uniref:Extracellular membrane protein CFEM domain-containing protein n=1 Tax=Podospora australis TaxID=1536484 RepID=A0AAN6X074_9PEZI|nr:hypothetical protein QBC35DRAFT_291436 [Podospora australis]
MLLRRTAYKPLLQYLTTTLIWTTILLGTGVDAQQTKNVTSEILNFVPTCAQECFRSFISANFDSRICGNSPSLQCLCRQTGLSGMTVGEGAVSCIVGESRFGACQGEDSTSDTSTTAYNMCIGVSRAAPRTLSTIIATLIVPTGTEPVVVPTPSRTGTASTRRTSTTAVSSTPTPTANTSTSQIVESTATESTATSSSATSTATAAPAVDEGRPELSSAQIVGISLGCAAVVVFGIVLIFVARCIRRRRYGDLEGGGSGFAKMSDSMSFGKRSRPTSAPGPQISDPIARLPAAHVYNNDSRLKQKLPTPPMVPGANQQQQEYARGPGVGLGIPPFQLFANATMVPPTPTRATASPPAAQKAPKPTVVNPPASVQTPQPQIVASSPPKPTLTLAIPPPQERVARAPRTDSVVTEFAEDGEETARSAKASASVWRPPPTDPQSATALYFADKGGNWVLRNAAASPPRPERQPQRSQQQQRQQQPNVNKRAPALPRPATREYPASPVQAELPSPEHKTRAERAQDAYLNFSPKAMPSPLRVPSKQGGPQGKLGSPIAFKDQRKEPKVSRRNPATLSPQSVEPAREQRNQAPDTYFAMIREGRKLAGGDSRSRRRSSLRRAMRRASQDSATSIESAATPQPFEDDAIIEDEPQDNLSPVAESPQTPISPGKSPVTYPRIRKRKDELLSPPPPIPQSAADRRSSRGSDNLLPPAHRYNVWHPGHSGSGGRPSQQQQQQMRGPKRPMNPSIPNRNPGQMRSGSPDTRGTAGAAPPTIEDQYFRSQKRLSNPASYWGGSPPQVQPQQQQQQYAQRYQQPQQPKPAPQEMLNGQYIPLAKRYEAYQPPPQSQPQQQQQYRPQLQEQRRPSQPQLQIQRPAPYPSPAPTNQTQTPTPVSATSSGQSSLLAKRRGTERAAALTLANANDSYAKKAAKMQWQRADAASSNGSSLPAPPITPGWVPELTPTRRGDDLFLNVR